VCAGSSAVSVWGAAEDGDLAEVQRLIGEDPSRLNGKGPYRWTPLMRAAEGGHMEVVRWLVDQGAALHEHDRDGCTALCLASKGGRTPVVRLLLERGADPTIADDNGQTPLIDASEGGHLETVRCLLDHSSAAATINHRDRHGGTALLSACRTGHAGVVKALLEMGADPAIADSDGRTPMAVAQDGNHPACIEALKVRCSLRPTPPPPHLHWLSQLAEAWGLVLGVMAGGGAGLPALESPAGGRPAGERRGGGREGVARAGGGGGGGAIGLRVAPSEGGSVPGPGGLHAVRCGGGWKCTVCAWGVIGGHTIAFALWG
jgi:hypothetical protein